MILAIDIGNTNIEVGCIQGDDIIFVERIHTDSTKSELEYAISIKTVLEIYGIDRKALDGGIISSVVPPLTNPLARAVKLPGSFPGFRRKFTCSPVLISCGDAVISP